MRLLALAGDIDAPIAHIRLRTPLAALCERERWSLRCLSLHACTAADLATTDVLIVQRTMTRRAWRLQRAMRQRGGAVVYEIDDLLTDLPAHLSSQAYVQRQQPWLRRCMAEADAVSASTERLGRELELPAWQVVPNHALPQPDQPLPTAQPGQPLHCLLASMETLRDGPALQALREAAGPACRVVAVGPAGDSLVAAGVPVQTHALMPREAFIALARALPNAVAVIPLEDSRFAASKSAIKWFEYGEAGIPALCTDVSPYREVIDNGVTGLLVADSVPAWRAALATAADAAWRAQVGAAARAAVRRSHTLARTVDAWALVIGLAVERRRVAVVPAPGLIDRLAGIGETGLLFLRQFNRARLAKRRR